MTTGTINRWIIEFINYCSSVKSVISNINDVTSPLNRKLTFITLTYIYTNTNIIICIRVVQLYIFVIKSKRKKKIGIKKFVSYTYCCSLIFSTPISNIFPSASKACDCKPSHLALPVSYAYSSGELCGPNETYYECQGNQYSSQTHTIGISVERMLPKSQIPAKEILNLHSCITHDYMSATYHAFCTKSFYFQSNKTGSYSCTNFVEWHTDQLDFPFCNGNIFLQFTYKFRNTT